MLKAIKPALKDRPSHPRRWANAARDEAIEAVGGRKNKDTSLVNEALEKMETQIERLRELG